MSSDPIEENDSAREVVDDLEERVANETASEAATDERRADPAENGGAQGDVVSEVPGSGEPPD